MEMNANFYDSIMGVSGALYRAMAITRLRSGMKQTDLPAILQLRSGQAESPGWVLVQATEFDPDPLTVDNFRVRDVYASRSIVQAMLDLVASETWFDRNERGEYRLTDIGRGIIKQLTERQQHLFTTMRTLYGPDLDRLESLMNRVIDANLNSLTPPGTWCLSHSRRRAPEDSAHTLAKLSQYFSDLNAFRDDSHMAAWRPYDLEGYVWEAFKFVANGDANTGGAMFEQLAYRGYSRLEYGEALQMLAERGWLVEVEDAPGSYELTDAGRHVNGEAERLTNEYFYAPWSTLSEAEQTDLVKLLKQLRERLDTISTERPF